MVLALEVEPNTNEMNIAAKELGYRIEYTENIELKTHMGFLPAKIDKKDAGVEVYSYTVSDSPETFKTKVPENLSQGYVYQLRFGGIPKESQTAFNTAIILITKYNGVTIDDQEGALLTPENLLEALSYFERL